MRYLVYCSYDGTSYYGWQKQLPIDQNGVSEIIESAISRILNTSTIIHGSGRTDRGVHAIKQSFHFDCEKSIQDLERFLYSVNAILPKDIHLNSILIVDDDFHARFNVKQKTYLYRIVNGNYNPFLINFAPYLSQQLNISLMRSAAKLFCGLHCFINFTTKESDERNYCRTIVDFSVKKSSDGDVEIKVTGDGFMRYMVRFMVGALIQVGLGRMTKRYISDLLKNTATRIICHYKAESCGLYLFDIEY